MAQNEFSTLISSGNERNGATVMIAPFEWETIQKLDQGPVGD